MKFKPPRGTQDFLPEEMNKRNEVLDTVRNVFERFGFEPIETPAFEEWELLSAKGGDAIKDEIYFFKDKAKRGLGLRFDMTVPLARVVASNPDIPKPFRRYAIGRVWRYDKPGVGRRREFWQADIDIVGSASPIADVECIAAAAQALEEIGITEFKVRINNRVAVETAIKELGVKENKIMDVFRAIDKLDKLGEKGVKKDLELRKINKKIIPEILELLKKPQKNEELDALMKTAKQYGLDKIEIDPSLVRGLEYYTGNVFEISTGDEWSIAGGGRYDTMIKQFGGQDLPAVGISLGIERIMEIIKRKKLIKSKSTSKIYIATIGDVLEQAAKTVTELRKSDLNVEINVTKRGLSSQLNYVNSKNIPILIIIGERDLKENKITIRDMKSGEEESVEIDKVLSFIENM